MNKMNEWVVTQKSSNNNADTDTDTHIETHTDASVYNKFYFDTQRKWSKPKQTTHK